MDDQQLENRLACILDSALSRSRKSADNIALHPALISQANKAMKNNQELSEFGAGLILLGRSIGVTLLVFFGAHMIYVQGRNLEELAHGLDFAAGLLVAMAVLGCVMNRIEKQFGQPKLRLALSRKPKNWIRLRCSNLDD